MAEWAGLEVAALPEQAAAVMAHCGRLPLALSLCGAMVRDGESWDDLLGAGRADLEYLDHPHGSILRSIKLSAWTGLAPDDAARFAELRGSSRPMRPRPKAAVATLWAHTGGLSGAPRAQAPDQAGGEGADPARWRLAEPAGVAA